MDTLTFGTPILYRHLTFSEAKKQPILEVDLEKALQGLEMSKSQVSKALLVYIQLLQFNLPSLPTYVSCWGVTTSNLLKVLVPNRLTSSFVNMVGWRT